MLDLIKNKRVAILGLQGSGKSNFCKFLLTHEPNHLVYDTMREYQEFNTYTPHFVDGGPESREELSEFIQYFVLGKTRGTKKLKLILIDEANTYCHSKPTPLPLGMTMLNDKSRHFDLSMVVVARRPVQLHTDLVELAHYLVIFNLRGIRDEAYLEEIARGLGETVINLKPFHYALVNQNREVTICKPVKNMDRPGLSPQPSLSGSSSEPPSQSQPSQSPEEDNPQNGT